MGRLIVTLTPPRVLLDAVMSPLCPSTRLLQIDKPKPLPPDFLLRDLSERYSRSKILFNSFSDSPGAESSINFQWGQSMGSESLIFLGIMHSIRYCPK